jgi:hypothetical protein
VHSHAIQIRTENTTISPSVDGRILADAIELPAAVPIPSNLEKTTPKNPRPFNLGPKTNGLIGMVIPIERLARVERGETKIVMWRTFVYREVFSDTPNRLTEFCFEINRVLVNGTPAKDTSVPDIADPSQGVKINADTCIAHNCYDENCPNYNDVAK